MNREAMEAESERSSSPLNSSHRRRRKPLSDNTNFPIPISSVFRKISASLPASPPSQNRIPKPRQNPDASSKPSFSSKKTKPDATDPSKSDTSIGSSSYNPNSAPNPKTPTRTSVASSGNRSEEVLLTNEEVLELESIIFYEQRETIERTKDKGKVVDGPLTYSTLQKTKDSENSDAMLFSPLLRKTKDKRHSVAVPSNCSLANKGKDKGKASAVSFAHLAKMKDNGKAVSVPTAFASLVNTRSKSKAFDMPFSCPPRTRTKKILSDFNGGGDVGLPKSRTVPPNNKKKRRCLSKEQDASTHDLPREFVEQQRAYFKDIDDFELAEEEVSEGELDNEENKKCYNHGEDRAP